MSDVDERSAAMLGSHGDTGIMSWEQADQIMQEQRAEIASLRARIGMLVLAAKLTRAERHFLERFADASGGAGEVARSLLERFG